MKIRNGLHKHKKINLHGENKLKSTINYVIIRKISHIAVNGVGIYHE